MLPLAVSALQTQKPVPEGTGYNPVVPPFWTPSVARQGGPEAGETKDHRERTSQRWSGQPHTQQVRDPLWIRYLHPLTGVNRHRLLGLAAVSPCNSRAHSTLPAGPGSQRQGLPSRVSPSPRLSGPAVERLLFPFAVFTVFGCVASYHGSAEVSSAARAWGRLCRTGSRSRPRMGPRMHEYEGDAWLFVHGSWSALTRQESRTAYRRLGPSDLHRAEACRPQRVACATLPQ